MTPLIRSPRLLGSLLLLAVASLFVLAAELLLRRNGVEPWQRAGVSVEIRPGGELFMEHPTYGYTNMPGHFVVTKRTGYSFRVTHLPSNRRATRVPNSREESRARPEIWIFGCSFTYGWSLNDEETYPWLLQERFPGYDVKNFGVNGYGTLQSLLQFRDALGAGAPVVVVLAYGGFHDARNTFSRTRRKSVVRVEGFGPLQQPYALLDRAGRLQYHFAESIYREFPLMRQLALAHFVEMKYNELQARWHRGREVSKALISEMQTLAEEHEVKFVVANISGGRQVLRSLARSGTPTVDIAVDLRIAENNNLPHDGHPSVVANRAYAERLGDFLESQL